jgi:hypothetical protein
MKHIQQFLPKTEAGKKKVRLLGISISNFDDQKTEDGKHRQIPLPFKLFNVKDSRNEFQPW